MIVTGSEQGALWHALARAARARDLTDEDAFLAAELASWPGDLEPADRRALALLTLCVIATHRRGSTRAPLAGGDSGYVARELFALAEAAGESEPAAGLYQRVEKLIARREPGWVIGDQSDPAPLCATADFIASQRMVACEQRIAAALAARLRGSADGSADDIAGALDDVLARPAGVTLSAEQTAAVAGAGQGRIAIISGGPGTGKTAIAAAILRLLARLGIGPESIALAAPTGKAAHRLAASLAAQLAAIASPAAADRALLAEPPRPQTLHMLLGYMADSGRFRYSDTRRLPKDAVLVDEASMIDAELMDALLRALAPQAKLILLGDADQLPSVEAGAVFRDLSEAAGASANPVTFRLTESYRMRAADPEGRQILAAAGHIQRGEAEPILSGEAATRRSLATLAWSGMELFEAATAADARPAIDRFYDDHLAGDEARQLAQGVFETEGSEVVGEGAAILAAHIERMQRSQILAATRRLPGGAAAICRHLHARHAADVGVRADQAFCPGEPILITRNDHDRGLLNGDYGICAVTGARKRGVLCAILLKGDKRDRVMAYPLDDLAGQLESAFAITIHKSQGSEYDHVAVILPPADVPLLTRELIYTAVTRARKSAALIGPPGVIRAGIERRAERFSGIAEKVQAASR